MSYTKEFKIIDAAYPRYPGGTILVGQRLKIAYNKYTANYAIPKDQIAVNLIFAHGTGMNKLLWNYHINKLFEYGAKSSTWKLASAIAVDAVNHGDSAISNEGKLGWGHHWDDFGKDLIQVVKTEQGLWADSFENGVRSRTIVVGHSFGGFAATYAASNEPGLFDSAILVEPVLYFDSDPKQIAKFTAIFKKISRILLDTFDSLEDYEAFFKEFSFYKNFHPQVLKDMMDDELYTVIDQESGETKYKTKTSTESQVVVYVSSAICIPHASEMLKRTEIPVSHIIGKAAKWNPPESITSIRNSLGKSLWKTFDIENGEHLVNGDLPDDIVRAFTEHIDSRVTASLRDKDYYPEIQHNYDAKKIFDAQYAKLMDGQVAECMTFRAPARDERL